MEKTATPTLFTADEQRQLIWLQLSLTLSVIAEFILVPPLSYVASAVMIGFPLVLWVMGTAGSALRSCAGRHLVFMLVNYYVYPLLIFFFISQITVNSPQAAAQLLELMPDNEWSFVQMLRIMIGSTPSDMNAERLIATVAFYALIVIYARVILLPLLNIYYVQKQKTLFYPITL